MRVLVQAYIHKLNTIKLLHACDESVWKVVS